MKTPLSLFMQIYHQFNLKNVNDCVAVEKCIRNNFTYQERSPL